MAVTIRPAEDSDVAAMARIRAEEWGEHDYWVDRITRYRSGEHSPQKALAERVVFVSVDGAEVVGFVAGHRTRRFDCDGELQWVNIAAIARGQRVAERLIARMGQWFAERRARRVCVNVTAENVVARRVYTRCGATALGEQWMIWDDARNMFRIG